MIKSARLEAGLLCNLAVGDLVEEALDLPIEEVYIYYNICYYINYYDKIKDYYVIWQWGFGRRSVRFTD